MLIRFWGTRGSIPVALTGAGVRSKIKQALLQANGRHFDDDAAVERFIDEELDFPIRHSYGGNSACVDIVGGTEYMVCDMGLVAELSQEQAAAYFMLGDHRHRGGRRGLFLRELRHRRVVSVQDAQTVRTVDYLLILNRNENIIPAVAKLSAAEQAAPPAAVRVGLPEHEVRRGLLLRELRHRRDDVLVPVEDQQVVDRADVLRVLVGEQVAHREDRATVLRVVLVVEVDRAVLGLVDVLPM